MSWTEPLPNRESVNLEIEFDLSQHCSLVYQQILQIQENAKQLFAASKNDPTADLSPREIRVRNKWDRKPTPPRKTRWWGDKLKAFIQPERTIQKNDPNKSNVQMGNKNGCVYSTS